MPRVDAIDIARYQIVTDEAAIQTYPLMTCKGSEGTSYKDATRVNWLRIFAAVNAPIRGMYHWVRSDSTMAAQVNNIADCYRQAGALNNGVLAPGWIVQLDWERTYSTIGGVRTLIRDCTVAEIEQWIDIADATFGPGRVVTYASDWVPGFYEWRRRNPDKPVWYANYRLVDDSIGGKQECARYDACLWQWSSQVMVPGIDTASRPGIDVSQILKWEQLYETAHLTFNPPTPTETDMDMKIIATPGDPAAFITDGITAKWVNGNDGSSAGLLQLYGPVVAVPKTTLRGLYLIGDEPDYGNGAGNGPTTIADFAGRLPQVEVVIPPSVLPPFPTRISLTGGLS